MCGCNTWPCHHSASEYMAVHALRKLAVSREKAPVSACRYSIDGDTGSDGMTNIKKKADVRRPINLFALLVA